MNTINLPSELAQLPLIELDLPRTPNAVASKKKRVEETFAKIRQLHDELNAELYAHPAQRPVIHGPADAAAILDYFIGALDHEEMWAINLDTRNRVMCLVKLYQGSVNSSQVRVGEVFRQAILENAPAILVAHNHPSGDTSPSPEDASVTRAIVQAGKLLDIDVLDHIIVSHGQHTSLKERGLGFS
jgi:DNA repair protein RadC